MPLYRILGGDQKEYGPATEEQVREWIAEGRVNTRTRMRREDSPEWSSASEFPEFAEALGAKRSPGLPPPPRPGADAGEAMAARILGRDYRLDIGRCLERSWELLKGNFWLPVGATFLVLLVESVLGAIPVLKGVGGLVLGGVFAGGIYYFFLKLVRGQPAAVGDAFAGFRLAFVPLMLAGLVSSLLTALGLLFCILPGIYLGVAWVFTELLVVDKGLDFWPAMELSRKVVTKHWWAMLGLLLVLFLLVLGGLLLCLVGVFFTIPLAIGALVYAYEDIFGREEIQAA